MTSVSPISLWHGTSSALRPSISKHGLGGRNIVADLGVVEFIVAAVDLIKPVELDDDPDTWLFLKIASKIADQTSDHMNWRHGQVYVSASKFKAASYAMNAPEAIDTCRKLDVILRQQGQENHAQSLLEKYDKLARLLFAQSNPIVIELFGVPCDALLPETNSERHRSLVFSETTRDDSPCAQLHELAASNLSIEVMGQGACFTLDTVWPPERSATYSVTQTGSGPFYYAFNPAPAQQYDGIA